MKTINLQFVIIFVGVMLSVVSFFMIEDYMLMPKIDTSSAKIINATKLMQNTEEIIVEDITEVTVQTTTTEITTQTKEIITTTEKIIAPSDIIVFEGLTANQLTDKLNSNLYDLIAGTGVYFTNYTIKTGLDPYLAVAIILQETGCKWGCFRITRECNNVGGIKGSPSCNGGSYKRYESMEEGIIGYLDIVYNNYYSKGLTTAELMNPKYASSTAWAGAVNSYINKIKE